MLTTEPKTRPTGANYLTASDRPSPNQTLLPLTAKINERDRLEIGGCDVVTLVERFGSPLYILDEVTLRTACRQYRQGFQAHYPGPSRVIYASKAWSCLAVCALIAGEGLGFDVVSAGEIHTTLTALERSGHLDTPIYFHGNNKSEAELRYAVESGCTIIVDNWLELEILTQLGSDRPISILLRLTPGIECHTHEYIRTGHLDSKFGFDPHQIEAVFDFVLAHPALQCVGLHAHIGSQIFERQPHQDLAGVLAEWFQLGLAKGLPLEQLNVGGGLGIRYVEEHDPPSIEEWVRAVSLAVAKACDERGMAYPLLIAEPGRSLIATACITAYTIGSRKEIPDLRTYIAVDGGMSDNPRPITYQSVYRAVIANKMSEECQETVTVAGKHCESGDILIKDIALPSTEPGDILVVLATGAYNYSMASNYNRLPRPAAVLVYEGEANLVVERETLDDLLRQDRLPARLSNL
jgi:diaminopimelate decarboxylase